MSKIEETDNIVTDSKPLIPVNRYILSNGLKVVHHFMPESSMVTLDVLYNVGAAREDASLTGIAHLFEHMMFGGSDNIPDFDDILTQAGGISNAWTSNDFTNFYEICPAHNAETLFYLESDRMLHPAFSQDILDVQKSVVIEEFKQQCLNRPYGNLMHKLRPMVYGLHPYSWPVIGKNFHHIEKTNLRDLEEWWIKNYTPENAVLAITGNITFDQTIMYAEKWFEPIPRRKTVTPVFDAVHSKEEKQTATVYGKVPATMVMIAYQMDEYGTDSYFAADAITDILSAGQSSRFNQRINMNPGAILVSADASISGSEQKGMLMLSGRLANEKINPDQAADLLIETARSIFTEGITEHELQRIKNKQLSTFVMSNMACMTCAMTIAEAEMHNESPEFKISAIQRLTIQQIEETAKNIFERTQPSIVYYRPEKSE